MARVSLKLKPGVDVVSTPALGEAGINQSNLVRFQPDKESGGLIQKLGGWVRFISASFSKPIRALKSWADLSNSKYLAIGTEGTPAYLGISTVNPSTGLGNAPVAITPAQSVTNSTPNAATVGFSTTTNSSNIKITDFSGGAYYQASTNDYVFFQTPVILGNLWLTGPYKVVNVSAAPNPNYTIDLGYTQQISTIVRATNVVTVTTVGIHNFVVGQSIFIGGVNDATFNGTFTITGITSTTITYSQVAADANSYNGSVVINVQFGGTVPQFSVTANSAVVTVNAANHPYYAGATFNVQTPTTVGGITLSGQYIVANTTTNTFQITAATAATSTTTGYMNGGAIRTTFYVGRYTIGGSSSLYNQGVYNVGVYGSGATPSSNVGTDISATNWSLDNWGQILIANPLDGPIYFYNPTGGSLTNASYIPNSPLYNHGMFIAMPQRQIVTYGSAFGNVQDPLLVRWCDIEDLTLWTASSTNQAGSYRIPTGSKIIGGIQGPQQGLLWTNLDLWAMQYIGAPYVYGFNKISSNCGLIGQKAMGQMANTVYWMSQKQFFKYDGNGVTPILCPVWDFIFSNIYPGINQDNSAYVEKIRCATNSQFNEVTWYFPADRVPILDANGLPTNDFADGNGEVNAYVKYNVLLDTWDYGFQNLTDSGVIVGRTAWIDQSIAGNPLGAGSFTSGGNTYNYIYQHETSNDADGAAMKPFFTTSYFAISEGEEKAFIDQVWPDMVWGNYGEVNSANVKITFGITDYPEKDPTYYGPYAMYVGQNPPYITTRMRGKLASITLSSQDLGSFWRIGNIRYRIQSDGKY